jgi:hypothetical protein
MTPQQPDPGRETNGKPGLDSVADELRQESERLRQLAERLQAREATLSEMEANYPHLRQFVYAKLREEFKQTLGELPDTDLETLAKEQGAQPLDAFIAEIERPPEGP